jgi:glycosyltransferase involved in cell wall biosynthesis
LLAVPASEPDAFAASVARLYHDDALWMKLREGALRRLAKENSPAAFARVVRKILA